MKDGIINLLKPAGMTSHDGVQLLRRLTGVKRIGHTGTLDPMAVGVLPICIGSAARIMEYLELDYKKYRCEMQLGIATDTEDIWGTVLERKPFDHVDKTDLLEVLSCFQGDIRQIPPAYSAVKINGKKLYEYARQGIEMQAKDRPVHIKSLELVFFDASKGRVTFDVECSKGTYVRTLCSDAGKMLGCGAAMSCLIRTASGKFLLEDTVTIEQLLSMREGEDIRDPGTGRYLTCARAQEELLVPYLKEPDFPLVHFGVAYAARDRALWFINGGKLPMDEVSVEHPPRLETMSQIEGIREKYESTYNIYFRNDKQEKLFLGVAYYDRKLGKLVADKIFLKQAEMVI